MGENIENTFTAYLGAEFQHRLMWQLLVEPEFAEKTIPNLAVEYFDDPNLKRLFIIILEYYKEFGKVPNLQNQSIYQAINKYKTPNNIIEEESLLSIVKRISLWNERVLNKEMLHDGDIVQKETNVFIKQQEWRKFGEFIIDKVKSGEIRKKTFLGEVDDKIQKISSIGEEEDYGVMAMDNIEKVLRKEFREPIPTGIYVLDAITGGGLGKGEIGMILTPSGVGKTTLLTKIANYAFEVGKNVLQIIFEDTIEQIQRKHFAIWSKVPLSKMDDDEERAKVYRIVKEKQEMMKDNGVLIIKAFSQENTTMIDIRKWMINYQKKFGIKFDILILDYLDCVEPHKKVIDKNDAEYQIVKSFLALSTDFGIPAWTAIQTNRSGFESEYVEAYQTGGSIKRIQKSHFFMSIAKTKDQKEAQLANIRIIKARFAPDGQTFNDVIFNNDTMEIRIEDDRYKFSQINKYSKHHNEKDIENLEEKVNKISEIHSYLSEYEKNINEDVDDIKVGDIGLNKDEKYELYKKSFDYMYNEINNDLLNNNVDIEDANIINDNENNVKDEKLIEMSDTKENDINKSSNVFVNEMMDNEDISNKEYELNNQLQNNNIQWNDESEIITNKIIKTDVLDSKDNKNENDSDKNEVNKANSPKNIHEILDKYRKKQGNLKKS